MKARTFLGIGAATSLALAHPVAAGEEPLQMEPASAWRADFADDSCSLERTFARGTDTVSLRLRQYAPGRLFEITVASATLDVRTTRPRVRFKTSGESRSVDFYETFEIPDGLEGITFTAELAASKTEVSATKTTDFSVYSTGAAINALTLEKAFGSDLTLRTGSMEQPLTVMETCLDDLIGSWGLDPSTHRTLSRKAEPNRDDRWLFVTAPMQRDFLRRGSRLQRVRLLIDEDGSVFGCHVLGWPDDEPVAEELCDAVMKNAVIPPALDAHSNPVKSYYLLVLSAVRR